MANISFGTNILPKTNTLTIGNSESPWKVFASQVVERGIDISSNSDLDSFTTPGYYRILNTEVASTITNIPVSAPGHLYVEVGNTGDYSIRCFQTFRNLNDNSEYKRSLTSSGWTTWSRTAKFINLDASTGTLAAIYTKLNSLADGETALFASTSGATSIITGGAKTVALQGIVTRISSSQFEYLVKYSTNQMLSFCITGMSSSTAGTYTSNEISSTLSDVETKVNNFVNGGMLASNTNLNNVVTSGSYGFTSGNTYSNAPAVTTSTLRNLLVYKPGESDSLLVQICFTSQKVFYRFRTSASQWETWKSLDKNGEKWLPTSTYLNNIKTPGTYGLSSANSYYNTPFSYGSELAAGNDKVLEVIAPTPEEANTMQRIITNDTIYVRYLSGSSWGSWARYRKDSHCFTGTGTAGQAGSSTAAYIPSLWKFDTKMNPTAGDIIKVQIPVAGVNSGVWMSINNGTSYQPVATNGASRFTTHFGVNYVIELIYETGMNTTIYGNSKDGAAAGASTSTYTGARWRVLNFYDSNTTYSNASLGQGYGTCGTAASTTEKAVTLSSYALSTGGIVAVKFTYDVPANATLNINSKGAKAIYYKGSKITANVIKAGDIAVFIYSTYYYLLAIDRTACV